MKKALEFETGRFTSIRPVAGFMVAV